MTVNVNDYEIRGMLGDQVGQVMDRYNTMKKQTETKWIIDEEESRKVMAQFVSAAITGLCAAGKTNSESISTHASIIAQHSYDDYWHWVNEM